MQEGKKWDTDGKGKLTDWREREETVRKTVIQSVWSENDYDEYWREKSTLRGIQMVKRNLQTGGERKLKEKTVMQEKWRENDSYDEHCREKKAY